jgi:integrase/recombinase XerD
MKSVHEGVNEYLAFRCRLGFKLLETKHILAEFATYMERHKAPYVTSKLALGFAKLNPKGSPARWAVRLAIIRRFCEYWKAIDSRTEVPPLGLLPHPYHRRSPYIYTDNEINLLLKCCLQLQMHEHEQYTYFILFGLLSVTGMRISEVLNLTRDSVDTHNGIIKVSKGKFQKSRYLPLHKSTTKILQDYIDYRDRCILAPKTANFFLDHFGRSLSDNKVRRTFVKLLTMAAIKKR